MGIFTRFKERLKNVSNLGSSPATEIEIETYNQLISCLEAKYRKLLEGSDIHKLVSTLNTSVNTSWDLNTIKKTVLALNETLGITDFYDPAGPFDFDEAMEGLVLMAENKILKEDELISPLMQKLREDRSREDKVETMNTIIIYLLSTSKDTGTDTTSGNDTGLQLLQEKYQELLVQYELLENRNKELTALIKN